MLGDLLLVWLWVLQPTEILPIQLREPEAVSAGDDAVEDRPAEAEAARLTGEPSDHLDPPANLLHQGPLH